MLAVGLMYMGTRDLLYDGQAPRKLRTGATSGPDPDLSKRIPIRCHKQLLANGSRNAVKGERVWS